MTVNLSTQLFYNRSASAMQSLTAQADKLNTQITAQQNVLAPSDNSVAWQRLQGLARSGADDAAYASNVTLAGSVLQQASTSLTQITDQLQNASELVVQAQNGTLSDANKSTIADQLSGILQSIVGLVNAKDTRGGPLFGGASGDTAVTSNSDGSLSFTTGEGSSIPIGDGQSVQPSNNAASCLQAGSSDLGTALTAIVAALKSGGTISSTDVATLKSVSDQTIGVQASIGARAARVDLQSGQIDAAKTDREATRAAVDGFDYATSITDLQKTMTVLQATQASFSKLSSLSLFDYLK